MRLCVSSFGCSTDSRSTERAKSISELRLADFRQKWQVEARFAESCERDKLNCASPVKLEIAVETIEKPKILNDVEIDMEIDKRSEDEWWRQKASTEKELRQKMQELVCRGRSLCAKSVDKSA